MSNPLENFINSELNKETNEERYLRAKRSIYNPDFRFLLFQHNIVGSFAKWAINQSPYIFPENFEKVITAFADHLEPYFTKENSIAGMRWFTLLDLETFIEANLKTIPEFLEWNDRKNGREGMGFSSRDSGIPDPDDDFIDLHALYRNICHDLYNDAVTGMPDEDYKKQCQPENGKHS